MAELYRHLSYWTYAFNFSLSARNIIAGLILLLLCVGSAALSRYRYMFTLQRTALL